MQILPELLSTPDQRQALQDQRVQVGKKRTRPMTPWLLALLPFLVYGCLGHPASVQPVTGFKVEKYLGKWYEIARLDHPFEQGLEQVTAEYSFREDGGILVRNRGFSVQKKEWVEAEGKAYFAGASDEGFLKVSFFGPFYGAYVIFELEKDNYQYAFVSGWNTSYLWFLARTPEVSKDLKAQFEKNALRAGFRVQDLIYVNHKKQ